MKNLRTLGIGVVVGLSWLGCEPGAKAPSTVETSARAVFNNGNFESGGTGQPSVITTPTGWTQTTYLNPGVTMQTPQTREGLNLQSGGAQQTALLYSAAGAESQPDSALGSSASLRWPKYGNYVSELNMNPGSSNNVNSLSQTMTIGPGDIDPSDGKAHVRFAVAPVLENPSHPAAQQPYYFVQLTNLTRSSILYRDYNASAQPGVPWKTVGSIYYTDWQLVDIAPGSAQLAIDDQVQLEVIAAGCSQGGHYGRIYLDGVGAAVPGIFTAATGPAYANDGQDMIYTIRYKNGGTSSANNVVLTFNTPSYTSFQSISAGGLTCTTPTVNTVGNGGATSAGLVTCPIGSVAPDVSGSITVTVRVVSGTSPGTLITAGNYAIAATGLSPLLGPKVFTTVSHDVSYADLSITVDDGVAAATWEQGLTYTIVASNAGPTAVTGATVTDTFPAELASANWTCAGAGGGTCTASGSGNISDSVDLPVGASVTYTVTAPIVSGSGNSSTTNNVSIAIPGPLVDPDTTNNAAADRDLIGTLNTLTVTKDGAGAGTVVSVPASINCAGGCPTANAQFLQGSAIALTATPSTGDVFLGWSGGGCTGRSSCTLTLSGDTTVTATFSVPQPDGTACSFDDFCSSAHCVDGVCCATACGNGSPTDCQACNMAGSLGTCSPAEASIQCRPATGDCDLAEYCTGSSTTCPTDTFRDNTNVCRSAAGDCDVEESCTGSSAACPTNGFAANTVVCRAAAGVCDLAENCTGSSASCPADVLRSSSVVCRAAADVCDTAENCTGSSVACPTDAVMASTVVCRAAVDLCDAAEYCTGSAIACPLDVFQQSGTLCRAAPGTCDVPEYCTGGSTACPHDALKASGTLCSVGACSNGVQTLAAVCPGSYDGCPAAAVQDCGPYNCGNGACLTSCSSSADCRNGAVCENSVCHTKQPVGQPCTTDAMCAQGHCVDGFCCNQACQGQCEACDVDRHHGECVAVTGAPRGNRKACSSDGSRCGGTCGGQERQGCAYPGASTQCRAPSCSANTATLEASCDGAGACPTIETADCGVPGCDSTLCKGDCRVDSDCASGSYCAGGFCRAKLANGTACTGSLHCASGFCVDGVCCDKACDGQCEACDVAGAAGTCRPVLGAPHAGRTSCISDGTSCGGACDGKHGAACAYPGSTVECRTPSCTAGVATAQATCDGKGSCPSVQTSPCAPYACSGNVCAGNCSIDSDCVAGDFCLAGVCKSLQPLGATCSGANQCASNFCVDGVCCDNACAGQCQACNLPGTAGTCSTVKGQPAGSRAACVGDGSVCAGSCDGVNATACTYPGSAVSCRAGSCSAGVATQAASCNGRGVCPLAETVTCYPNVCGTTACLGTCRTDSDCLGGNFCLAGVCTAKRAPGKACAGASECSSGNCVDGVCCNSACNGQCEACDVAGKVGVCSPVLGTPRGARTACTGTGLCAGQCDGVKTSTCAYPDLSTLCSPATCTSNKARAAVGCDGSGACSVAAVTDCGSEGCDGTTCKVTCTTNECKGGCTTNAECGGGNVCVNRQCVAKTEVKVSGGCSVAEHGSRTPTSLLLVGLSLAFLWRVRRRRSSNRKEVR